jgi:hypothetical protein
LTHLPTDRHRAPGWSWRCPHCPSSTLQEERAGILACQACASTIHPPPHRSPEPRLPTTASTPRWDDDARLLGAWDRYSRPGRLVEEWGSAEWRGLADDRLDHDVTAYADQVHGSVRAIDAIRRLLRRRVVPLGLPVLQALALILVNSLRRRGVSYLDSTDEVAVRLPRSTPFAGHRHALAVGAGTAGQSPVLGGGSLRLGGATPKHRLPKGLQFGVMACAPSRSGGGGAPGEDAVVGHLDLASAMAAARVGRRHENRDGRCVLADGGRPLAPLEWTMVQMVDHGRWSRQKGRAGGMVLEPMGADEAAEEVRQMARRGELPAELAAVSTKEARKRLKAGRKAYQEALRERGLIPPPRRHAGKAAEGQVAE